MKLSLLSLPADCIEKIASNLHTFIVTAKHKADDSLRLCITLLSISIPVAIAACIAAVVAIRRMWRLLSTYCSPIEWSLRLVMRDPESLGILQKYMRSRHSGGSWCH